MGFGGCSIERTAIRSGESTNERFFVENRMVRKDQKKRLIVLLPRKG